MLTWYAQSKVDTSGCYWHGTPDSGRASGILRDGIAPQSLEGRKGFLAPVKGMVYLTPSLQYAIIYALGGDMAGHSVPPSFMAKDGPTGYVFKVDRNDLTGAVQPDEDSVGEAIYRKKFWWLNDMASRIVAPSRMSRLMAGEYAYFASVGKQVMPHLTEEHKKAILSEGGHVAHRGAVKPSEAWEIDKRRSQELRPDGSNFFEIASQIL